MKETEGLYRFFRLLKRVAIGGVALLAGLIAFGYLFFIRQVDKTEAWSDAERELHGAMLQYGEHVVRIARVYVRRPTTYFRGTNGILAATERRVLYVGFEPRDKLASPDAPAAILTAELPADTGLSLELHRVYGYTAHGVTLTHGSARGTRTQTYAAVRGHGDELDSLAAYLTRRSAAQRQAASDERRLRAAVDSMLRLPLHYRVQRGDALSTIATRFGATQDELRAWNHLTGNVVKIGAVLLVKPAGVVRTGRPSSPPAAAAPRAP